jgi:hypothetical protein
MTVLKIVFLFVLMFAAIFAAGGAFADTLTERIISWGVFLLLLIVIYAPGRWWWKKG